VFEGALSEYGGNSNINVKLVNAKTESILWDEQYRFIDDQFFTYQDTIIKNILTELEIDPIGNDITSSTDVYKSQGNFKLIGKGILEFDNENYPASIKSFDSVLESDPENIVALYHKANTYFEQNKYDDAMNIYKDILGQSGKINPVDVRWPYPERDGIYPLLCTNIEMIEDKDLAIMLKRRKKSCLLLSYNLTTGKTKWEEFIDDTYRI
jgi:tetratricopeptide (TPR) repeat protein